MGQSPRRAFARAAAALVGLFGLTALASLTCSCDALIGTEDRYFADDAAPSSETDATADATMGDASSDAAADASTGPGDAGDAGPDASPYVTAVIADAPLAWWRFEEPATSTVAFDQIAQVSAAATGNGVAFAAPGVVGNGVSLDGVSYLDVGNKFDLAGFQAFTFEAWLKADWHDYENLFTKRDSDTNGYVLYVKGGPQAQFEEQYGGQSDAVVWAFPGDAATADFVHVAITYDVADGVQLYVNGVASLEMNTYTNDGGTPGPIASHLFLGQGLTGTLDEMAIYDHALAVERISAHYQAGVAGK